MRGRRWSRALTLGAVMATGLTVAFGLTAEVRTSWLQSELLSGAGRSLTFHVEPGPSDAIRFPSAGPYDQRLGYVELPAFVDRLRAQGFKVERQARLSARHQAAIDRGAFPIYREKTAAGLAVLDRVGDEVFGASFPERLYTDYDDSAAPDRGQSSVHREPRAARRGHAAAQSGRRVGPSGPGPARQRRQAAQPEPQPARRQHARHPDREIPPCPAGRTEGATSKLRQMVSASLRAYLEGPDTSAVRRQVVVDYLNSTPLSARAGFGEVNGLGDGLWAWFSTDFELANRVLSRPARDPEALREQARLYKQVLSLLLAQRRPSYYLLAGRDALRELTDGHLRLLAAAQVIDPALARAALELSLEFQPDPPARSEPPFVELKAANAIRTTLLKRLGLDDLYRLDRLDLRVETSLDLPDPAARHRSPAPAERSADREGDGPVRPPPARPWRDRRSVDLQPDAV